MKPSLCACDERGNVDVEDLRAKAEAHKEELARTYDYLSVYTWYF